MPVILVSIEQLKRMIELCTSDTEIGSLLQKEYANSSSMTKITEAKNPEGWKKNYLHGRRRNTKEGVSVRVHLCPCRSRYYNPTEEQMKSVKKVGSEYVCSHGEYTCPQFKGVKDTHSNYGFEVMCDLADEN